MHNESSVRKVRLEEVGDAVEHAPHFAQLLLRAPSGSFCTRGENRAGERSARAKRVTPTCARVMCTLACVCSWARVRLTLLALVDAGRRALARRAVLELLAAPVQALIALVALARSRPVKM